MQIFIKFRYNHFKWKATYSTPLIGVALQPEYRQKVINCSTLCCYQTNKFSKEKIAFWMFANFSNRYNILNQFKSYFSLNFFFLRHQMLTDWDYLKLPLNFIYLYSNHLFFSAAAAAAKLLLINICYSNVS